MIVGLIYFFLLVFIVEVFYYYNKPSQKYVSDVGDELPSEIKAFFNAIYYAHPIEVVKKSRCVCDITLKKELCRFQAFVTLKGSRVTMFVFTGAHEYIYESTNVERNLIILNALNSGDNIQNVTIEKPYRKLTYQDKVTFFK